MSANPNKLVILGAAESGIGAALLGKQQGWDVFVSDGGMIKDHFRQLLVHTEIQFEEGGHSMDRILQASQQSVLQSCSQYSQP